jgi:two-component system, sensor histidine kinase and response regulator
VKSRFTGKHGWYKDLLDSANSIILVWDKDGNIVYLNPFGMRLFGFTEDELNGKM